MISSRLPCTPVSTWSPLGLWHGGSSGVVLSGPRSASRVASGPRSFSTRVTPSEPADPPPLAARFGDESGGLPPPWGNAASPSTARTTTHAAGRFEEDFSLSLIGSPRTPRAGRAAACPRGKGDKGRVARRFATETQYNTQESLIQRQF